MFYLKPNTKLTNMLQKIKKLTLLDMGFKTAPIFNKSI